MAHWRRVLSGPLMEIQYEDLVSQQEVCSRALIEFCGLDWNDACIDFYRSQRDINTSSNWQVRQPIYRESAGRWKHYEKYLQPLMKLFEDASDEL